MPISNPSLSQLAMLQLLVGVLLSLSAYAWGGAQVAVSVLIGASLMLGNILILGWSWQRLMAKKSIAWTVLIIVIKYAVLLGSTYLWAHSTWFSVMGAGIGISSLMLASLVLAGIYHKKETGNLGPL